MSHDEENETREMPGAGKHAGEIRVPGVDDAVNEPRHGAMRQQRNDCRQKQDDGADEVVRRPVQKIA